MVYFLFQTIQTTTPDWLEFYRLKDPRWVDLFRGRTIKTETPKLTSSSEEELPPNLVAALQSVTSSEFDIDKIERTTFFRGVEFVSCSSDYVRPDNILSDLLGKYSNGFSYYTLNDG